MSYGTGTYGAGVYGVGAVDPGPPVPSYVHEVTTVQVGDSGIVLSGGPDEFGVEWSLQSPSDPWQPKPEPRDVSGERSSGHGSWNATEYLGPRMQELSVHVHAPDHASLHVAHQRWKTAVSHRGFRLTVDEPGFGRRWSWMRQRGGIPWTETVSHEHGAIASTSVGLVADDPLIYGEETHSATTWFPASTGGLEWPAEWPAMWDADVESGLMVVTSAGSEPAPASWRIHGPVTEPFVTDVDTGARMRLAMDIPAGDWVVIDTRTGRVSARGDVQASRRAQWSGDWLQIRPGTSTFGFGGAAGGGSARVTVSWQDAWV